MVETILSRRWTFRVLFVIISAVIAFAHLLPLHPGAGGIPGPDLLLLVAMAWVLRRPDYIPAVLVAVVMLMADFLFMRPPGLWAALTVLGVEFLRQREQMTREMSFLVEWATVAAVVAVLFFANAIVLAVFLVDQPALGLTLIRLIATILLYPIVVALAARAFGLRKPTPGEVDKLGLRQ